MTSAGTRMIWLLAIVVSFALQSLAGAADEPQVDAPLLAHWPFNEPAGSGAICEAGGKTALDVLSDTVVPRTRGVHAAALELSGEHALKVAVGPAVEDLRQITFSAWTRPTVLSSYREIFRQECAQRLLFSFQQGGTILSLGLSVGGYVECDAQTDPQQLLDGGWHHTAATFDGHTMRVYLDGREIGSLQRPGELATQTAAPAFIGSSSGRGEFFQGGLDELRIYRTALTPEQIEEIYQSGVRSTAKLAREFEEQVNAFYHPGDTFAETLAATRRALLENRIQLDRDHLAVLLTKLKADFSADYQRFAAWTDAGVAGYLRAEQNEFNLREARRLVALALEYRPLTESQKLKQTPQQCRTWAEVDAISGKLDRLEAAGPSARFSPQWIEIILAAGGHVQFRPAVAEAVAPYVTPQTPTTRDLTADEARRALDRDWLYQADNQVTPQRVRREIGWTRQLAARIGANFPDRVDFTRELAQLEDLEDRAEAAENGATSGEKVSQSSKRAVTTGGKVSESSKNGVTTDGKVSQPWQALYFAVRHLKRSIMLKNPVVDFTRILLVDMPYPQGKEWPHQTRHRLGYMAVPGGRLLVLEGLAAEGGVRLRQLMPQAPLHGSFWRADLSYDARKVLFCFKPHNEKSFHLYEINIDGGGLVQLTDGPFDDLDPIYLPDGKHIIFSTTRGHTYVRCMPPTNAYPLARADRDGKNIYLISRNNEPDYLPTVMNDGRIVYTRWEYTDKPLWRAQGLWTVNPDGTGVATYWGNQSVWPDLLKDARSIPGSRRVMFCGSAHHNWFGGSVGIIDPDGGNNFPQGITKVTADVEWPESGNGPVDPVESPHYHPSGHYTAYYSPYPLSEEDFLVSANRQGKFVLYLMDTDGNRELIYEGTNHVFHALPVRPRKQPPLVPDRVQWPDREHRLHPAGGVIFSNNVYQGAPAELRHKAKYLRILTIQPKTYTYWYKRPYISTGPVVSMVQSEGVKQILGTVPIEADGSVAFRVPSGEALHFQLLDEHYRALQTMRSFTGVMPGEQRGCLGCHESHSQTPSQTDVKTIALDGAPRSITPPPWGDETIGYMRFVQPVLDKYCGQCHQGDGQARKQLDLAVRPGFLMFDEPYVTLIGRPTWGRPYEKPSQPPPGFGIADMLMVEAFDQRDPAAYATPQPMTALSYGSRLIEIASSGEHYQAKVDPLSLRRLIAWVDAMCPYRGDEEVRKIDDPQFQGVDWLSVRPKIKTAPTIVRPGPVD